MRYDYAIPAFRREKIGWTFAFADEDGEYDSLSPVYWRELPELPPNWETEREEYDANIHMREEEERRQREVDTIYRRWQLFSDDIMDMFLNEELNEEEVSTAQKELDEIYWKTLDSVSTASVDKAIEPFGGVIFRAQQHSIARRSKK